MKGKKSLNISWKSNFAWVILLKTYTNMYMFMWVLIFSINWWAGIIALGFLYFIVRLCISGRHIQKFEDKKKLDLWYDLILWYLFVIYKFGIGFNEYIHYWDKLLSFYILKIKMEKHLLHGTWMVTHFNV